MDYDIFEFTWREDVVKDWVKAPSRKEAIYFIMRTTSLTFGEVIKGCNIRKLSIEQQHKYKVTEGDVSSDNDISFYEYAKEIDETNYIASTAFY
jgi:hypothetical protein